jgi:hypothetical protein
MLAEPTDPRSSPGPFTYPITFNAKNIDNCQF